MTVQQFVLVVNDSKHKWSERCIRGREILRLGGTDSQTDHAFQIFSDGHGERIDLDEQADLMQPGVEEFLILRGAPTPLPPNGFVHFHVDNESMIVRSPVRKVRDIIGFSGNSPAEEFFLLEFDACGAQQKRHDDLNADVTIIPNSRFAVVFRGCPPVSFIHGVDAFVDAFHQTGFAVAGPFDSDGKKWCQVQDFTIPAGRFAGLVIIIAVPVSSDFPITPPGGLYVCPAIVSSQLMGSIGVHDRRNETSGLGDGWQYWSRPIPDGTWRPDNPARRLITHWNSVFSHVAASN